MSISRVRVIATVGSLGVLVMTGCTGGSVAASISGAELYEACAPCHGAVGEGNATLRAPAIAGLPASYVSTQLQRSGGMSRPLLKFGGGSGEILRDVRL